MAESAAMKAAKAEIRALKAEIAAAEDFLAAILAGGPNAFALERALGATDLNDSDAALVQSLRTIAAALDSGSTNSQLFREYREGWRELVAQHDEGEDPAGVLAALRNAAQDK